MFFYFLKIFIMPMLYVFHRSISVNGKKNIPKKGPFMLASRHPNTFMDAWQLAIHAPAPIYFLTNSSVFTTPFVSRVLNLFYMAPITRPQDVNHGVPNNTKTFSTSYEHWNKGGLLMIFPEGGSDMRQRIQTPLKTGTARMSLEAEEMYQFKLDIKIVPATLVYRRQTRFGASVYVQFLPPMNTSDYQTAYQQDRVAAIRKMTRDLEDRLVAVTPQTADADMSALLLQAEALLTPDVFHPYRLDETYVRHSCALAKALCRLKDESPDTYAALRNDVAAFDALLQQHKIDARFLQEATPAWMLGLGTALLSPLAAAGAVAFLPMLAIPKLGGDYVERVAEASEYRAPVAALLGLVTYISCVLFHGVILAFGPPMAWLYAAVVLASAPAMILWRRWGGRVLMQMRIRPRRAELARRRNELRARLHLLTETVTAQAI